MPCLVLAAVLTAVAAETYQPQGAPADPKVAVHWNRYHDYAAATAVLKGLAAAHPQRARLQSLGRSYGGREMWLLSIANFAAGDDRRKPAFWIDGGIHGNEIQAAEVALYTAWYLLEMYGRSDFVTRLVDQRAFYILPMLSPDTRDAHMHHAASTHSPRSGLRPVDNDGDGQLDEDGPDDLNGDGHITQMRIADPNGRWRPHPDYPELLVPAREDEPGQYRLLDTEGFDNDGDGEVDEDGPGGYDPNRDWAWDWQPPYVQYGAYRYPFSIAENRLVADFIIDHANIAAGNTFHNAGGMILRPPALKEATIDAADAAAFDALAKRGETILPNYRAMVLGRDLYEVRGGELDWFFNVRGAFVFCNELFTPANFFRRPPTEGPQGRQTDAQLFDKYLLFRDGTVPWTAAEHPQYGPIEVGGQKKNWGRQPPSFLLEEECHRNMAFALYHADQMPRLSVQAPTVRRLSPEVAEVTATIANGRLLPTRARWAVKHKIGRADIVSIEAEGASVAAGLISDTPFFENAKEQRREPARLRVDAIEGMSAAYVRWLVRGRGPFTVRVDSEKGGTAEAKGTLP